jgi:hypothetical protein
MHRTALAARLALLLLALPPAARAADPPGGASSADPFAPGAETKEPSADDQEAAVFGSPTEPAPGTQPAPSAGPAAPMRRPAPNARARRVPQAISEEASAPGGGGGASAARGGFAIELSTTGFASGSLAGGLFLGGRTTSGVIIGGFLDYALVSVNATPDGGTSITRSGQAVRIGAGVRHSFVHSADRLVDLYGAGDVGFESRSAEIPLVGAMTPTQTVSAAGFSLAVGPGLRLWVHDQIALGYAARLRLTYLSGDGGSLEAPATASTTATSATAIAFDGTFQILGVF